MLDAYALVALLADEPAAGETESLLRRGDCGVALVNLAEAVDVSCRVHGLAEEEVRDVVEPMIASATISTVVPTEETAWRAAQIRVRHYSRRARPVSLADCFLLASVGEGDSIATSDLPVAEVARAESIDVIPLTDSTGHTP